MKTIESDRVIELFGQTRSYTFWNWQLTLQVQGQQEFNRLENLPIQSPAVQLKL